MKLRDAEEQLASGLVSEAMRRGLLPVKVKPAVGDLKTEMVLATQRLIVPITAKDKARVERKAAKAGKISTAEFVRRAALNYEPADEEAAAELRQLVDRFEELHAATLAQLDRTDAALDTALAHFKAKLG